MSKLFVPNLENEQKLISYLLQNPDDIATVEIKHFNHDKNRIIAKGIKAFVNSKRKLIFDFDTLLVFIRNIDKEFNSKLLYEISEAYTDFSNIEFCKQTLVNDYMKYEVSKELESDLLGESLNRGYLNPDKVKQTAEKILSVVESTDNELDSKINTVDSLKEGYLSELNKRFEGKHTRTLGYAELDKGTTKPAEPGQTTTIFGNSGSGKTTFVKNIENRLVDKGVCTVSINTESGDFSALDLMFCIKTRTDREFLKLSNNNKEAKAYVESKLDEVFGRPNHMMIQEPTMDFKQFESVINKARKVFRDRGVLPDDGYMVIIVDLISDFEEFGSEQNEEIVKAIKMLDNLVQKYRIHVISVLQTNESKIRGGFAFKKPEDLDFYQLTKGDIYGSSAYSRKAKLMIAIQRPVNEKIIHFPAHEDRELWLNQEDTMQVYSVKVNEGGGFFAKFLFDKDTGIVAPYMKSDEVEEPKPTRRILES